MDSKTSLKKVFHTALVITPPINLIDPIQNIRKHHDKAYDRWMPHVNLAFPFFDSTNFDEVYQRLQKQLENFPSFNINLRTFNYFNHGKSCTLWLYPETEGKMVEQLFQEILKAYPQLDDLSQKGEHGYAPRIFSNLLKSTDLSCGQFSQNKIDNWKNEFQKQWNPITFECQQIHMIKRDDQESPFYITHSINLKSSNPITAQYLGQTKITNLEGDLDF